MNTAEAITLLRTVVSGNVSDAMEQLDLPRSVLLGLTGPASLARPVIGPAYTVQQTWKPKSADRKTSMVRHGEVTRGLAQRGDVVVIATGGITSVATWGENHSMRCRTLGVVGMVTDGATRDAALVAREGFSVFCRAVSPVKSLWDLQTVGLNETVTMDDVTIAPGDLVFADDSGILVLPKRRALDIAKVAADIRRSETTYQATVR